MSYLVRRGYLTNRVEIKMIEALVILWCVFWSILAWLAVSLNGFLRIIEGLHDAVSSYCAMTYLEHVKMRPL